MEKPNHLIQLEERFKRFLEIDLKARNLDQMLIPSEYKGLKRADYVSNEIIFEIKTLKDDPSYKIEKHLTPHKEREEFPDFYWNASLQEIFKHLPDGKQINDKIFYSITKSVQHAFESADDQIRDTNIFLSPSSYPGVLVLLNEDIKILDPKIIAYIVRYMMSKKRPDGSLRYEHIHYVYLLTEAHYHKIAENKAGFPMLLIDGPQAFMYPKVADIIMSYNYKWAAFNRIPIARLSGSPEDLLHGSINSFDNGTSEMEKTKERIQKEWIREYTDKPYLRVFSETAFIEHGKCVGKQLFGDVLKEGSKLTHKDFEKLMRDWAHFLEEAKYRSFDMKKLR